MKILELVRRLLSASALLLIGGIAISVMTHDAWLLAGHVAGIFSAVIAAIAVMLLVVAGLRRIAIQRPPRIPRTDLEPHEMGLTGLEATDAPARDARSGR